MCCFILYPCISFPHGTWQFVRIDYVKNRANLMMNLFIHPILFWLNMTEDFLGRFYSLSLSSSDVTFPSHNFCMANGGTFWSNKYEDFEALSQNFHLRSGWGGNDMEKKRGAVKPIFIWDKKNLIKMCCNRFGRILDN
jgi:hypothetical protein